jgi:hypothetical protein
VTTSLEYRQFARKCAKWADEATTDDAKKSLLDLAEDWIFAALVMSGIEKQQTHRTDRLSWRPLCVSASIACCNSAR